MQELRGKTMGIVGYEIRSGVCQLATVYGMRIIALRRHPISKHRSRMRCRLWPRQEESEQIDE
jgi:phosphoglycerate dehydrogenase-like enzyme